MLTAVLLISALAFAAEPQQLPKDMPPYGPLKAFTPPKAAQDKLPNGLTLWLVPQPGFPKVVFAIAVRGGMASDPPARPGLSQFLVNVLNEGTKTRSAQQIAEELQAAGGDFAATARADALIVSTEVLASKTEPALAVLADILQNANFPQDEVELVRSNMKDALQGQEAQPTFVASRALAKAVFGEHPYSVVSGTQQSLSAITRAELLAEYGRRFRPDQAVLVVVGDFDAGKMKAAIANTLGGWKAPARPAVPSLPAPPATTPHAIFFLDRPGSVQTTLVLASLGPNRRSPDFSAAQVANAIYGGMFGSRVIHNIREDKGYSYSPFGFLQTRRLTGLFQTRADVRNPVTAASFNELQYELNRMATTTPTEEELNTARRYLVGNKAIGLQARSAVAGELATLWVDGLPPEELGLESQRIEKVAAKEVETVGRKYYPAERVTVVAVGEPAVIQEQLKVFGLPLRPGYRPGAATAPKQR